MLNTLLGGPASGAGGSLGAVNPLSPSTGGVWTVTFELVPSVPELDVSFVVVTNVTGMACCESLELVVPAPDCRVVDGTTEGTDQSACSKSYTDDAQVI